jgi:hypothetical protein
MAKGEIMQQKNPSTAGRDDFFDDRLCGKVVGPMNFRPQGG